MNVAVTDSESSAPKLIWNRRAGKCSARKRAKEQVRSQEDPNGHCHKRLLGHALSELTRRDENETIRGNKFDFGLKIMSHKTATQI